MQKNIFLTLIVFFMVGCSTLVYYTPNPSGNFSESKLIIEQVIQEQPPKYAPEDVEVTNNYFKMKKSLIKRSHLTGGVTSIPDVKVVYYNSIGEIQLFQKRKWNIILIWDKNKFLRCRIYTLDEIKAKKFIDALYSLKENVN